MPRSDIRRLLPLVAALLLLAAACGSSGDSGATEQQPSEVSTVESRPAAPSGQGARDGADSGPETTSVPGAEAGAASGQVKGVVNFAKLAESVDSGSPFRSDVFFSIEMGSGQTVGSADKPLTTTETDGAIVHTVTDMGAALAGVMGTIRGLEERRDEMTMETYTDGEILLVKVPFVNVLHDLHLGFYPRSLRELGDDWGLVRASELGGVAQAMGGSPGSGVIDPESVAHLVAAIDNPSEGESVTIRGVEATQVSGEVTFGDLITAQGMDPEEFVTGIADLMASPGPEERQTVDDMLKVILASDTEITVAYDDQSRLVLLETRFDLGDVITQVALASAQAAGEEMSRQDLRDLASQFDLTMVTRVEFYDYEDPGIVLTMPDASGAVDVTDVIGQLFAGGLGAGF